MTKFFGQPVHIKSRGDEISDIAKTVLMPGDPLRAKWIAETYLENVTQFNSIRNILGFTGRYKGKKISVMGSGMGIPSACIYYSELFGFYDVDNIIRTGSAGGLNPAVKTKTIVIGATASTDSNWSKMYNACTSFSPAPSIKLFTNAIDTAKKMSLDFVAGQIYSSDVFYHYEGLKVLNSMAAVGAIAVEMETYGLYSLAAELNKNALSICTISDNIPVEGNEENCKLSNLTPDERQTSMNSMVELALEIAINIQKK